MTEHNGYERKTISWSGKPGDGPVVSFEGAPPAAFNLTDASLTIVHYDANERLDFTWKPDTEEQP